MCFIANDLTNKIEIENKLKQTSVQLQSILDNTPSLVTIRNKSGYILFANKEYQRIHGKNQEMLIGKNIFDVFPMETAKKIKAYDEDVFETEKLIEYEIEIPIAGEIFMAITSKFPLKNSDGEIYAICSVSTNITERKKREEVILKLNQELESNLKNLEVSNKELASFSYTISHDLRAPLRAIDGFTNILKVDYTNQLDEEAKRMMDIIIQNTKKMGTLIDNLLDFSKLGKTEIVKSLVNMHDLVLICTNELKAQTDGFNFKIIIQPIPDCYVDETIFKRVWINLISNAIKYSKTKPNPTIEIGCILYEHEYVYWIKDNGVGFNMLFYKKLFGVFQRLHNKEFEGTGVGLAIAERIIEKNQGKIWAEAEEEKGATFYFSIPVINT
jgi:PAS domain S-box-containing protein